MKFTSHLPAFLFTCSPLVMVVNSIVMGERFVVVSDYDSARESYASVQGSRTYCFRNVLDHVTKEKICKDVTSNYLFRQSHLLRGRCNSSKWFHVSTSINKPRQEFVFTCVIRKGELTLKYYISEEQYDIGGIATRFIFKQSRFGKEIDLYGLVQVPASTVSNNDYSIEHIYLQRRKYCGMICRPRRKDDALCKLEKRKLLRICIAVFNSKYFESKFVFPADVGNIYGKCEKTPISFQTELGKLEQGKRTLMEWTLNCSAYKEDDGFHYLISQAYQPNEIFVYIRNVNEDVFLENLSFNVKFNVDFSDFHPPAYIEQLS